MNTLNNKYNYPVNDMWELLAGYAVIKAFGYSKGAQIDGQFNGENDIGLYSVTGKDLLEVKTMKERHRSRSFCEITFRQKYEKNFNHAKYLIRSGKIREGYIIGIVIDDSRRINSIWLGKNSHSERVGELGIYPILQHETLYQEFIKALNIRDIGTFRKIMPIMSEDKFLNG